MNKYILIIISLFCFSFSIAQEDTTFVQAHNYVDMDWYGNYDAWGVFPDGTTSYRKILMHYYYHAFYNLQSNFINFQNIIKHVRD